MPAGDFVHLNRVTWLVIMAAGLSLAADVIQWAWVGQVALTLPEINGQALSAMEWLNALGPSVAWLFKETALTLQLFAIAAWVEVLSRIHRRLQARNAVQFQG
jgi:hypothetical protein